LCGLLKPHNHGSPHGISLVAVIAIISIDCYTSFQTREERIHDHVD
jgi:hypothetical protein